MITLNRWADVAITDRQYRTYTTYELETALAAETQKVIAGDTRYNASVFFNHDFPPDRCSLRTDLELMRDSLLPIIINAIQNTTEGMVVISISVRPDSKELVVDIKDTGHGIPVKDQQRIFELHEQIDVYSTGAGIGLTLASRFAALLKGSIELVWSEPNCGSHFRATFQDMELKCSESPLRTEPAVTNIANIPRRFHLVPSKSEALSLSDHFAKSLTSYGFTASDSKEEALIILDFEADSEQHHAAILGLPPDRVVLCPVPFPEEEARFDNTLTNVVYVHGPFGAQTLSAALQRASKIISLFDQAVDSRVMRDLVVLPKLSGCTSDRTECEGIPSGELQAVDSIMTDLIANQIFVAHDSANAPGSPKPLQPHGTEIDVSVDSFPLIQGQLPTPPADNRPANYSFQGFADPTAKENRVSSTEHQTTEPESTSTDYSLTSLPTALLVDDNAINLRVMQMYCKKRNLQYVCARDGLEAISVFQNHQECAAVEKKESPIQLILMDLQMPTCDGIEATKRIRQLEKERNWVKSIVLMVTGQDSPADRAAAHAAGSQEYHVKPISMKTLDTSLKRHFPCFQASNKTQEQ